MKQDNIRIIPYNYKYAEQTVKMWRDSKEQAIGQKEKHSFENHVYFLNQTESELLNVFNDLYENKDLQIILEKLQMIYDETVGKME